MDTERLIGGASKNQTGYYIRNTVFDVRRPINCKLVNLIVHSDIMLWSFKVISGQGYKPMIVMIARGRRRNDNWQEIPSMIHLTKTH